MCSARPSTVHLHHPHPRHLAAGRFEREVLEASRGYEQYWSTRGEAMLPGAEVSTLGPLLTSPQLHEPPPSAVREPLVATATLAPVPTPSP